MVTSKQLQDSNTSDVQIRGEVDADGYKSLMSSARAYGKAVTMWQLLTCQESHNVVL